MSNLPQEATREERIDAIIEAAAELEIPLDAEKIEIGIQIGEILASEE